jgi:hypothetical protein
MTTMTMHTRRVVGGALLLIATATPALGQDRRPAVPALVREAQELLIAAYPELREGRLSWRIVPTESGVTVDARVQTSPFEEAHSAPLVAATVVTDEHGRIQELHADGALIAAARAKAANPTTQPRFAPDDPAAVEGLVPAGLQARLQAPTLRARSFTGDGSQDGAPAWQVDVESNDPVPQRFTLAFEPVEGRLLSVVRR